MPHAHRLPSDRPSSKNIHYNKKQQQRKNDNAPIEAMGVSTMSVNTKRESSNAPSNEGGSGSVPSGFILKLFQMVNGAPDELISVSEIFCFIASNRKAIGIDKKH